MRAALAQLVERRFCKARVLGSSPRGGSHGVNVARVFVCSTARPVVNAKHCIIGIQIQEAVRCLIRVMYNISMDNTEQAQNGPAGDQQKKEKGECMMCKFVLIFSFAALLLVLVLIFLMRNTSDLVGF